MHLDYSILTSHHLGMIPVPAANTWFAAIRFGFGNDTHAPKLEVKLGNAFYGESTIHEFFLIRI